MLRVLAMVVVFGACTKAGGGSETAPPPGPGVAPVTKAPAPTIAVVMTAATLADDCGGTAPYEPPPAPPATPPAAQPKTERAKADSARDEDIGSTKAKSAMRRRCEQTSMQLAVTAPANASPTHLHVKKVELYDPSGKLLGELAATKPTRWSDTGVYEEWDEAIAPNQALSVSYVLAQPAWDAVEDRWNKTYTVKAIVTVGATDQTLQQDVEVRAPTILPPNVKT